MPAIENNTHFLDNLSELEKSLYREKFPILFGLMVADKAPEKYQLTREMASDFYQAKKTVAFSFYKPISQIG